jgi:hypothetical protein
VSLEEFDTTRQPQRRHKKQLALPSEKREQLLLQAGYSKKDIDNANYCRQRARTQRQTTVDNLELDETILLLKKVFWKFPKRGLLKVAKHVQQSAAAAAAGDHQRQHQNQTSSFRRHSAPKHVEFTSAGATAAGVVATQTPERKDRSRRRVSTPF